ncbi:MAG: hypothetical protein ACW98I_07755 [Candidatus Hodarchaeales archaeon]|jgi:predicted nucleic-acid-binding Zn-ribbon protein
MIISQTCQKCNGSRIAGPHRVHADRSHSKIDLPGLSTATFEAYTCVDCGYTEFYVDQMGRENIKNSGRFLSRHQTSPEEQAINYGRSSQMIKRDDMCSTCGALITGKTLFCHDCGSKLI